MKWREEEYTVSEKAVLKKGAKTLKASRRNGCPYSRVDEIDNGIREG